MNLHAIYISRIGKKIVCDNIELNLPTKNTPKNIYHLTWAMILEMIINQHIALSNDTIKSIRIANINSCANDTRKGCIITI